MNLATLTQSQTLATLLKAIAPGTGLAAGTVEARLLALAGDGTATAQIGDTKIALVLAGPEARQAALTPGATLLLKLVQAEQPGAPLRATLLDVRQPATAAAASSGATAQPPAPSPTSAPASSTAAPVPAQAAAVKAAPQPPPSPALPQAAFPAAGALPSPVLRSTAPQAPVPGQPAPASGAPGLSTPGATSIALSSASAAKPGAPAASPQASVAPALAAAIATPRAIAGPLLGPALGNQDGLAPLMANLRGLVGGTISPAVPAPVLKLAGQILAQAVPVARRPLTAEGLRQAVQRSGLFMEARQGAGQPATPQTDLKAGLSALRDMLEPMLSRLGAAPIASKAGSASAADAPAPENRLPPPRRDGPLALQPIAEPTLTAGEKPVAIAETLLRQTDAALDRITLSQYASLLTDGARADQTSQRWLAEVPLAFQSGTAMLPLQVEREPGRQGQNGAEGPLWRVRFALDVEPMGPLQGVVTLQGRSVGVTLWAEREETSRLLRGASPGLEAALLGASFENGNIDIHTGQPRVMQATAGQFLDRLS